VSSEPDFLSLEEVLFLHEEQLFRYGGAGGVRDLALLESAAAMPKASFDGKLVHGDLFAMAAAYAFHIAENHPFVDGNKRTGLAAALVFLDLNAVEIRDAEGRLYGAMLDLAERRLDKVGFALALRRLAANP
jgi:death-on-curing protein